MCERAAQLVGEALFRNIIYRAQCVMSARPRQSFNLISDSPLYILNKVYVHFR